jgi:hypothetical protein
MATTTTTLPDGSILTECTDDSGTVLWTSVAPPPGSPAAVEAANRSTIEQRAQAALTANATDQAQDANIITQAAAVGAGTCTTAQLSNLVRQLAQAVSMLAQNDTNRCREINGLIRLALQEFDATD